MWSHGGRCITQQVLSLLREGGAESNEMHMILYSGVHNLQLGLLGVKPEDLTLKWNAAGCVDEGKNVSPANQRSSSTNDRKQIYSRT